VRGHVQGVGFRAHVLREATLRGLAGEVWNRRDGAVEGFAQCESSDLLEDFFAALRRGPGRVDEVARYDEPDEPTLTTFRIGLTR